MGTKNLTAGPKVAALFGAAVCAAMIAAMPASAAADMRLAKDVAPAPFGYEAVTAKYVVVEETPLYVSTFTYLGKANDTTLKPGQAVNAIAKAKNYDWILVGQNGVGIGYVPLSNLALAK
jgi:hypothetical protein